jgi:DNA-directed RNA polymerase specialized sigma24 family protein
MTTSPTGSLPAASAASDFAARLELYYRENVQKLVRRNVRNFDSLEDARDAVQEAITRIYAGFVDGDRGDIENLDAYVNRTVRHIAFDKFRRDKAVPIDLVSDGPATRKVGADGQAEEKKSQQQHFPDTNTASADDVVAWRQLLTIITDRLPPKWQGVAAMVMADKSPVEIGKAYDQDGYVLRRYARELVCRILRDLGSAGDPLALAFSDDICK